MMNQKRVEDKLAELNLTLPQALSPIGAYVPFKIEGETLWLSGVIPVIDGKPYCKGRVGESVNLELAIECARITTLNALSWVKEAIGSLDRIDQVLRLQGFVASAGDFFDQPKVLNGASDLLVELFGDAGKHTRIAVGVCSLPLNVPVEIDFVFKTKKS